MYAIRRVSHLVAPLTAALLSEIGSDGSHVGNLSRLILHRFALPLPAFRGSKGPIWRKLSLQQLRRPLHIHTPLVSANAVNMWCMECIWTLNCMRLSDRQSACMYGGRGFLRLPCFAFFFLSGILGDGCAAVGLAAGQGGLVCMHPSRSLGAVPGPHLIHVFLTCAVRGA